MTFQRELYSDPSRVAHSLMLLALFMNGSSCTNHPNMEPLGSRHTHTHTDHVLVVVVPGREEGEGGGWPQLRQRDTDPQSRAQLPLTATLHHRDSLIQWREGGGAVYVSEGEGEEEMDNVPVRQQLTSSLLHTLLREAIELSQLLHTLP